MQRRRISKNITLKGLSKDVDPLNQPQDTYREAKNAINISQDGDTHSLTNEKGTSQDTFIQSSFDSQNYIVIGHVVLDDDNIYFSVSEDGLRSEVGVQSLNSNYTTIVNSDLLGFSIDYPIDAQARKLFNNNRIAYWTDDFNPPRVLNLDDVPSLNLDENTELFGSQRLPVVDYVETLEQGNLEVGTYQFVVRYLNENFDPLYFGVPSNPIPVVDDIRIDGYNSYDGAEKGTNAAKSIVLEINNIDTDFEFLELAVITYTGPSSSVQSFLTERRQITGPSMRFTFSDKDQSIGELSLDELYLSQPSYSTAKTIEQKDGRLFLGNLTSLPQSTFQQLANQIKLKYSVDVIESGGTVTDESATSSVFDLIEVYVNGDNTDTLVFSFNDELAASNADPSRFSLIQITHDGLGNVLTSTRLSPNSTADSPVSIVGSNAFCIFEGMDLTTLNYDFTSDNLIDIYAYGYGSELDNISGSGTSDVLNTSSDSSTKIADLFQYTTSTVNEDATEVISLESIEGSGSTASGTLNSFTDYKDEGVAANQKTYKRGEAYSFGLQLIFKNGALSPVLHIPGNDRTTAYSPSSVDDNRVETVGDLLGTYISEEFYPLQGGYPSATGTGNSFSAGNRVRHHFIPTQQKEPIIDVDGNLRLININPVWDDNGTERTILELIDSNPLVRSNVSGFIFLRQKRDSVTKTSKVMQGVAMNMWNHQGNSGTGGGPNNSYVSTNFLFGKTSMNSSGEDRVRYNHDGGGARGFGNNGDQINDLAAFYSPENIFLGETVDVGAKIKAVALISGDIETTRYRTTTLTTNGTGADDNTIQTGGMLHEFCNYKNIDTNISTTLNNPTVRNAANTVYNGASDDGGQEIFDRNLPTLRNYYNEGYLLLDLLQTTGDTSADLPESTLSKEVDYNIGRHGNSRSYPTGRESERYLYDITRDIPNQYGSLDSSEYVPISVFSNLETVPPVISLYGGDIFISYVGFKNTNMIRYRWRWRGEKGWEARYTSDVRSNRTASFSGEELAALFYFPVESKVNCNYRHVPVDAEGNEGVPYYPLVGGDNVNLISGNGGPLDASPAFGESNGYNELYSKENDIGIQSSTPLGFEEVTEYPNRVIYSQKSFEGERSDKYRFFLANDTHDIPKHSGEIWDMFTHNGKLWIHTEKSLWRTFVNERTAVGSSTGDIFLGNGGLFPLPSQEVFTIEGGHAGTTSQWGNVKTPYGYFWVDQRNGKLFKLTTGVEEVSTRGMKRFFEQNFKLPSKVDNPFNPTGQGLVIGYDKRFSRLLITNARQSTISYSLLRGTFISEHDYKPAKYVSQDDRLFSITNQNHEASGLPIWEHNIGDYGNFYGTVYNMEWTGVVADSPDMGKTFDNLFILTDCFDETNGVYDLSQTFTQIRVYNETQSSDLLLLDPNQSTTQRPLNILPISHVRNGEYRLSVPRDLVLDHTQPIDDPNNLATIDPVLYENTLFPRIKGRYILVQLVYDNSNPNKRLTLKNLLSGMRINFI